MLYVAHYESRESEDVQGEELSRLQSVLDSWVGRCNTTIEQIEEQIQSVLAEAQEHAAATKQVEEHIAAVQEEIISKREDRKQAGGGMSRKAFGKTVESSDKGSASIGASNKNTRKRKGQI